MPQKLIPRDVHTRWNSTYDMLDVAVKYKDAVDALCSKAERGLRTYELMEDEWRIVEELRDTLMV